MNTCGNFLEVFILKGLQSQKNPQNTAKSGVSRSIHSKGLGLQRAGHPRMKKAAEGLPHS
jgi:hypothetical protein